jgi:hypothetical protein
VLRFRKITERFWVQIVRGQTNNKKSGDGLDNTNQVGRKKVEKRGIEEQAVGGTDSNNIGTDSYNIGTDSNNIGTDSNSRG